MEKGKNQKTTEKITVSLTPMMQQYLELKEKYHDTLLFYRMGDFYEMFFEDAELAARILGITLTSRDKQAENPIPMCGVPYHAADNYISKLLEAGHKVAICEQVEDPKKAKGLVKRQVVRVLTPGLVTSDENLEAKNSNYLAAIARDRKEKSLGLSYLDITTAEFKVTELETAEELMDELARVSPKELLVPESLTDWFKKHGTRINKCYVNYIDDEYFSHSLCYERLTDHFQVRSLAAYGCDNMPAGISAAGALLAYLLENHQENNSHLTNLVTYFRNDYMILDDVTLRNLEIFYSPAFQGTKGTLLEIIDRTITPMGGRLLRQWLRFPLQDVNKIRERYDLVEKFIKEELLRLQVREELKQILDIQRLSSRAVMGIASPRDLSSLRASFRYLPSILNLLQSLPETSLLARLLARFDTLDDLTSLLEKALVDDPPATFAEGGIIRKGYDEELDNIRSVSWDAKSWLAEYEAKEREQTGITNLKVRFNKVFGYFIEISKSNLDRVPDHYIRKQTLVNAERYITEELKNYEIAILESEEKRVELEQQLFEQLRREIAAHDARIKSVADIIALIDVMASFAELAVQNSYCRPEITTGDEIIIRDGRHPVVEKYLTSESFVPNDIKLDSKDNQILIITGPNMAGKSTIIRQVALIVLLAHIGCFVPCSSASVALVDRIFTRVGAMDDLARGRSTFMVEMEETANILRHATPKSLVILDEIGRGTSTFDGLSIAWAVAEYLHNLDNVGVKTLFATHYHEMTRLSERCPRVKNMNVLVREWKNEIIFLRKLVPGGGNRSYGIQVARLAGLPEEVLKRADKILQHLEKERKELAPARGDLKPFAKKKPKKPVAVQIPLFDNRYMEDIKREIVDLDINNLTPLEALNFLSRLQERIKREEKLPRITNT